MHDAWEEQKFAQDFGCNSEIKIPLGTFGFRLRYNI
jgi:hypothetical protein